MRNIESFNSKCILKAALRLHGMIDARAYYCSRATWPAGLTYVKSTGETVPIKEVVVKNTARHAYATYGCSG
jgi:hypothetical protein